MVVLPGDEKRLMTRSL